jgi:hypothetical protein
MRHLFEKFGHFFYRIGIRDGLFHVSGVHAHFMKEEMIEPVKVLDVPHTFSEIGAKQRPELLFFCRVDQL